MFPSAIYAADARPLGVSVLLLVSVRVGAAHIRFVGSGLSEDQSIGRNLGHGLSTGVAQRCGQDPMEAVPSLLDVSVSEVLFRYASNAGFDVAEVRRGLVWQLADDQLDLELLAARTCGGWRVRFTHV